MNNKKKAFRLARRDKAKPETKFFGGHSAREIESKNGFQNAEGAESLEAPKEPMEKMMMRLPRSLALDFQQLYLQLAARTLTVHGKKLYVQDCHIEAIRDWTAKQRKRLAEELAGR